MAVVNKKYYNKSQNNCQFYFWIFCIGTVNKKIPKFSYITKTQKEELKLDKVIEKNKTILLQRFGLI